MSFKSRFNLVGTFSILMFLISFVILYKAIYPYFKNQNNESNPNNVVDVASDNYKLNQSSEYPIGALITGLNTFYLSNTSNEKVKGKFLLKVQTKNCDKILIISSDNSSLNDRYYLYRAKTYNIPRNFKLNSHGNEFIYYKVLTASKTCTDKEIYQKFPISIISWKLEN